MRAKEISTEWYFDIINPVLAEICRKNKIAVYTFGNMIHSKGNMPYSMGNNYVHEPRIVEACSGKEPAMPKGGSIARWFVEMGQCAKILNPKTVQAILDLAEQIDDYTYFYEIEQVHIDPFAPNSFIAIEKRLWNEARQYGLTETEYKAQSGDAYPLCERLHEGVGVRKPTDISSCEFEVEMTSPYGADDLRKLICETTGTAISVAQKCKIPTVTSDDMQPPISGTAFSITAISGKEKTAITEHIKRSGGKVVTEYSPKTAAFIAKQLEAAKFIEENSDSKSMVYKLVTNSLLSGIARKILGEKVYIIRYEDFINGTKEEKPAQDVVSEEQTFNEQGELVMTIAQAEAVWTVKTGKTGYTVSGYTGKDETLFVPAYIDGKPVETIGKGKKNAVVKKVIIPGTIKKICTGAFPGYKQLADVVFTNEKVAIGDCAFTDCPLLLDENHCLVMRGVLHDSDQQGDVVIPGYVRVIPQSFMQKSSIKHMTSLTLMDGIEEIGQDAFNNCKELKKLVICDTVTEFFGGFSGCYSLETIDLGNSIERIPFAEFAFCKSLKRVTIGKNVKEIACQAFAECTALRDIYYNGTMEQWNSLRKVQNWDCNTSDLVIHCEDGDFENK